MNGTQDRNDFFSLESSRSFFTATCKAWAAFVGSGCDSLNRPAYTSSATRGASLSMIDHIVAITPRFLYQRSEWFRVHKDFFLPSVCFDLIFFRTKVVILCTDGFEIEDLTNFKSVKIPQWDDPRQEKIAKRILPPHRNFPLQRRRVPALLWRIWSLRQ